MNRTSILALTLSVAAGSAIATVPHFDGFEAPGWTAGMGGTWNNFAGGDIFQVPSGTNGITSKSGGSHAVITNLRTVNNVFNVPTLGASGPYSTLGGYSSNFDGGFTAQQDVYIDTSWSDNQGFDFSFAISSSGGAHQRDFIWHVGMVGGNLLVNASNNSDRSFNAWKLQNENNGNNHTLPGSGWYTLENVFYASGGLLSVDFNLRDAGGSLLWSVTRGQNPADTVPGNIGGNRYGWMVFNNVDGLALDNTSLIPAPGALALLGMGGLAAARRRRA